MSVEIAPAPGSHTIPFHPQYDTMELYRAIVPVPELRTPMVMFESMVVCVIVVEAGHAAAAITASAVLE